MMQDQQTQPLESGAVLPGSASKFCKVSTLPFCHRLAAFQHICVSAAVLSVSGLGTICQRMRVISVQGVSL